NLVNEGKLGGLLLVGEMVGLLRGRERGLWGEGDWMEIKILFGFVDRFEDMLVVVEVWEFGREEWE
uniref:hypothetical protein n=1 Tax=Paenibacillus xylanexedens TaxID=528191 RepID=UPI001C92BE1A